MSGQQGFEGAADYPDFAGQFNAQWFLIQQVLAQVQGATLVKVVAVANVGAAAAAGLVDVQPLVNQVDGRDNAVPHGVVHGLPYFRLLGGTNAVILDPVVGDIGIAVFASRDISRVKATQAQANPGSARRFDFADGLYIGGVLNGVPTQYVAFAASGITVKSAALVTVIAPTTRIEGNLQATGTITALCDSTAVGLTTHIHSGVTVGAGNSGPPVEPS